MFSFCDLRAGAAWVFQVMMHAAGMFCILTGKYIGIMLAAQYSIALYYRYVWLVEHTEKGLDIILQPKSTTGRMVTLNMRV